MYQLETKIKVGLSRSPGRTGAKRREWMGCWELLG